MKEIGKNSEKLCVLNKGILELIRSVIGKNGKFWIVRNVHSGMCTDLYQAA